MGVKFSGGFKPPSGLVVKNPAPSYTLITGTGSTGRNIALNGTNGLTDGSYSASSVYGGSTWPAKGAFDGYTYNSKINTDAGSSNGGLWHSAGGSPPEWVSVDFGTDVYITGMRLIDSGAALVNKPKDTEIQVSSNGSSWTNHQSITWANQVDETVELTTPVTTRYIRLYVINNQSNGNNIQVDEWEILQPSS